MNGWDDNARTDLSLHGAGQTARPTPRTARSRER